MAAVTASMETSQTLLQSESHSQRTYTETTTNGVHEHKVKKKKSTRKHKDDGSISVSKSSEKLCKKMKASADSAESRGTCASCARAVYVMERIQAEKQSWHRECFRCSVCNKQLTVETYESDHMTLYCKQHFRQLFEPKPVDEPDNTEATPKKHQMIICESNPVELPPDVVRASDKSDLGLESISSLDVRSRWEQFESRPEPERAPQQRPPQEKGAQLLSKLAKFKAKGMDIGISDEYLNGVPVEASSSEPEDEEDADSVLRKSYATAPRSEVPVSLCNMSEIVGRFESGTAPDAERHRHRKQEIQNIRSRLFMGKQAKIKEMYEQSVLQSEQSITSAEKIARELDTDTEKNRAIKERFESGQIYNDENKPPNKEVDDPALFNEGIAKKSRSIFLELDANAKNVGPLSPPPQDPPKRKEIPFVPTDVVRAADKIDDVHIETADISDRFKFFETYRPETARKEFRMTPPPQQRPKSPSPEMYTDPTVVRSGDPVEDPREAAARQTASKMIHVFRTMEEKLAQDNVPAGPKPLKCFTPPPEGASRAHADVEEEESSEEEDSEEEREREWREARERDDALAQTQALARTKSFREKFENWREPERCPSNNSVSILREQPEENGESQLETAKSLRAKFENMTVQQNNVSKTVVSKVNRFV